MQTDTLIVGGGLSGLALAAKLQKAGQSFLVVEAAERLGGRILTKDVGDAGFDYGPAWFWPGQPRLARYIDSKDLGYFGQFSKGAIKYEEPDGKVFENRGFSSMQGSYRVNDGSGALIKAHEKDIDEKAIFLSHRVHKLTKTGDHIITQVNSPEGQKEIVARQVVLALPPRVAEHTIAFEPALPDNAARAMKNIPTWMAGQAKIVAIYDKAHWRDKGLSGDAMSRRGPMVEIHDASPAQGGPYALFGFVGFSARDRAQLGDDILKMAKEQLVNLFGPEMANPLSLEIKDWAQDDKVATPLDADGPGYHPAYGLPKDLRSLWDGDLILGSTETAPQFGGFLEGAMEAADQAFTKIKQDALTQIAV